MHVCQVFLGDLFLDPYGFHYLRHLNPRIRDLSLLPLPKYPHGLRLLMRLHDLGLVPVPHYGLLQLLPPLDHLAHHLGVGADPPFRERPCHDVLAHQPEQVRYDSLRVGLEESLPGDQTDTREDLHAHVSACNGTDEVHRVLLLLDVVGPDAEDVAATVHIDVVVDTGNVRGKSLFIVGLELLLDLDRMLVLVSHLFDDLGLLNLLLVLKSLELLSLVFFFRKETREFTFFVRESRLSPVAEGSSLVVLNPVLDGRPKEASAGLKLLESLQPRIETSSL